MSILQEYEMIKKGLKKGEFDAIERYLELHPELFLSDIYYNQEQYLKFSEWWASTIKYEHHVILDGVVAYTTEFALKAWLYEGARRAAHNHDVACAMASFGWEAAMKDQHSTNCWDLIDYIVDIKNWHIIKDMPRYEFLTKFYER